ncbi:Uncharacterised protein [Chryseobacterium gleum]|uniref:Uncharacterized protein n=2 Tax=Chryseobacterium gleum TaxID=250 RepID=A0A3S4QWQ1_CHRGE|nr:Uncharacterised protein [Chryseobacterium gleum]
MVYLQYQSYHHGRKTEIRLRISGKDRNRKENGSAGSGIKNPADHPWNYYGSASYVMKKRISYWFLLGLAAWGLIIFLRRAGIYIPVINDYFTDCITVPMYCYLIEYLMNPLLGYHWKPDLKFVLTSVLYLSFLFEVLCPGLSGNFTGDLFDVLAYSAGGMVYYFRKVKPWETG